MKQRVWLHAVLVSVLMLGAAVLIAFTGDPPPPAPPPRLALPERVGSYRGDEVLFCQNEQCLRSFAASNLTDRESCPVCGEKLDRMAPGEREGLPPDTLIAHRLYQDRRGRTFYVTVVVSGAEQKSIHRPQQCLPAQGYVIEASRRLTVPGGYEPLQVSVLDVRRTVKTPNGAAVPRRDTFAYWFTDGRRETPSYAECLFRMSFARLWKRTVDRWIYVGVATSRNPDSDEHLSSLREFLAALRPHFYPVGTTDR